jgi:hypothetical protein
VSNSDLQIGREVRETGQGIDCERPTHRRWLRPVTHPWKRIDEESALDLPQSAVYRGE